MTKKKGNLSVFYHFYKPDDVVSAIHFSELCEGLAERNWEVNVYSTNRYCRYPDRKIKKKHEEIAGVGVCRIWRPNLDQSKNLLRLINSFWIQIAWLRRVILDKKPDYFIVGSDPQFSQFMFPMLKLISPGSQIVYWCFDLYPEAIIVNYKNKLLEGVSRLFKPLLKFNYKRVDLMIDIGSCMRKLISKYDHGAKEHTLVPWALYEPQKVLRTNNNVRIELFGPEVKMVLMYSGNLGAAHQFQPILNLARKLRLVDPNIIVAFSVRGNRVQNLKNALLPEDVNIKMLPFAKQEDMMDRLSIADFHIITLKEEWSGMVVPSKFFGALAIGRPVIFIGPESSSISAYILDNNIGLMLNDINMDHIVQKILKLSNDAVELDILKISSLGLYRDKFSKNSILNKWDKLLSENNSFKE